MNDLIKILMQAEIDESGSQLAITKQIESLSKKLKPISIKVDEKAIEQVNRLVESLSSNSDIDKINSEFEKLGSITDNVVKKFQEFSVVTNNIDSVTESINKQAKAIEALNKVTGAKSAINANKQKLGSSPDNFTTLKELDDMIAKEKALAESIDAKNRKQAETIRLFKEQQAFKVEKHEDRYGSSEATRGILEQLKNINIESDNASKAMQKLRLDIDKTLYRDGQEVKAIEDSIKAYEKESQLKLKNAEIQQKADERAIESSRRRLEQQKREAKQLAENQQIFKDNTLKKLDDASKRYGDTNDISAMKELVREMELVADTQRIVKHEVGLMVGEVIEGAKANHELVKAKEKELEVQEKLRVSSEEKLARDRDALEVWKIRQQERIDNSVDKYKTSDHMDEAQKALDSLSVTDEKIAKEKLLIQLKIRQAEASQRNVENEEKEAKVLSEKVADAKKVLSMRAEKHMDKFGDSEGIRSFLESVDKLSVNTPDAERKIKELNLEMRQLDHDAGLASNGLNIFNFSLKDIVTNGLAVAGVHLTLRGLFNEIKEGTRDIIDLNSALTEIAMVQNKSIDDVSHLAVEYNNLARDMKVTTKEVAEGAVLFSRQGLEQAEVMERLEATTQFSKVANLDFAQSAELLTATVNSMGVEVEHASDVFTHLGDSTATSGAEIAEGFSKVSGTASALDVEFEKVASWIAGISAKTREDAGSIGNSINMILSRMSRLTEAGFDEEDGTKINDVAKALNSVGIALEDTDGTFRNFGDVVDDIGAKWDTLTDKEKAYVGNAISGARQVSRFYNLMESYTDTLELYDGALESAGTTQSKFNTYAESTQASADELKASFEGLWITLLDSGTIKDVIDLFKNMVNVANEVVGAIGGLNSIILIFANVALVKLVLGVRAFIMEMQVAQGMSFVFSAGNILKATSAMLGFSTGIEAVTASTIGLNVATGGALIGIGLLTAGVYKFLKSKREADEALENAFIDTTDAYAEFQQLEELANKQSELMELTDASIEQKQELAEVNAQLAEFSPELITGLDEEGRKTAENTEKTRAYVQEQRELLKVQLETATSIGEAKMDGWIAESEKLNETIEHRQKLLDDHNNKVKELEDLHLANVIEGLEADFERLEEINGFIAEYKNQVEELDSINKELEQSQMILNAEMLVTKDLSEYTAEEVAHLTQKLIDLGFDSEQASAIMRGGLESVEMGMYLTSDAGYEAIMAIDTMSQAEYDMAVSVANAEAQRTRAVLQGTRQRIQAMQAELRAKQVLHGGGKSINTSMAVSVEGFGNSIKGRNKYQLGIETQMMREIEKASIEYRGKQKDLNRVLNELDHLQNSVTVTSAGGSPSAPSRGDGGGSGGRNSSRPKRDGSSRSPKSRSSREEQTAEADRYERINMLLEKNNILLERNKRLAKQEHGQTVEKLKLLTEEIQLTKQHQKILHTKANQARIEAKELETSLSKSGFNFEGEGDQRMISNLEDIDGKSKEVEESFRRYLDLQLKEIPKLSDEWWGLKETLDQLSLDHINASFEEFQKGLKRSSIELASLDHQINMLNFADITATDEEKEENFIKRLDLLADKAENAKREVEMYERELAHLTNHGYPEGSAQAELYNNKIEEHTKSLYSAREALAEFNNEIFNARESKRLEWIEKQNKLYDEQQERLQALDNIQEKLVAIIRRRGEEEKKALDEAYKKEMESLEQRNKDRQDKYKEDLDNYKNLIDEKLKELDRQYRDEDYYEDLEKEKQIAKDLQDKLNVLSLDTSLEGRNKVIEFEEKLAEQKEKIAKMQQKRERDLTKENLKDMLKDKEKDTKDREDIANDLFENEKKRIEEEYRIEKEYLEQRYSNANVYSEARKALMEGEVEVAKGSFKSIEEALHDFEDEFGKGMGILGSDIRENLTEELNKANQAVLELAKSFRRLPRYDQDYQPTDDQIGWKDPSGTGSSSFNRHPDFKNWDQKDYDAYVANKSAWKNATSKEEKDRLKALNEELRRKYNMDRDDHSYDDLTSGYDKGGYTGSSSRRHPDFKDWTQRDFDTYVENKLAWTRASGDEKKRLEAINERLRKKYNMPKDNYSYLDLIAGYDTGGFIPKDGIVMAHEKEMYVPEKYQKDLWEFIQNIPTATNTSNISNYSSGGNKYIVQVKGDLLKDTIPDIERMFKRLQRDEESKRESRMKSNGIRLSKL